MNYRRILAIGDMHGYFGRLLSAFRKARFDPREDLLILLGDYVDRGPETMRCLRWVMEMREKENVIALRGNHEQMMLEYYTGGAASGLWLPSGGDRTRRALEEWAAKDAGAREKALAFIGRLPLYHRLTAGGREYIFCHAGLAPGKPLAAQTADDLLWIREAFFHHYAGGAEVIVGHTPVQFLPGGGNIPLTLDNNITLVDTGSYFPDGHISCIDVLSGTFYQSDTGLYD